MKHRESNSKASVDKCKQALFQMGKSINDKMQAGQYARSGGYAEFQQDLHRVTTQYQDCTGLGLEVRPALTFLLCDRQKPKDSQKGAFI